MTIPRPGDPPAPDPDAEFAGWLAAARAGDRAALGRVLDACRGFLTLAADAELGSTLRPKTGVSDVVQDSIADAHRGFDGFRGTTRDELLAWVGRIMQTTVRDVGRKYRGPTRRVDRERPMDARPGRGATLADPNPTPGTVAAAAEEMARVRAAVAALPPTDRRVIRLRHQDRRDWDAIGAALKRSPEAARKIWFRAVERLRMELNPANDDTPSDHL